MSETITRFDVTIDLSDVIVPAGMSPGEAVDRVRAAISAFPGAGWVSIDWSGLAPPELPWLVLYEPGSAVPQTGGAWVGLAGVVKAAAVRALVI